MKILIYSDVHGNKYALEELINHSEYKSADMRIFLGDIVSFCPYPNECINLLKNTNDIVLKGNHDVYCAHGISENEKQNINSGFLEHLEYIRKLVTEDNKNYLKTLKQDFSINNNGKKFYFSHFLWENAEKVANNPDGRHKPSNLTAKIFDDNIDADYIFFGHNHTPSIIKQDNKTFVCVGSLGVRSPANYVILNIENDKISITQNKFNYDEQKVIDEMLDKNYPGAKTIINFFSE
ncbi:MAG: metallophosphoesterase family protein [Clostridia bacterium]|nr:metallophosphoesterase family protein [Clostridia bacterium]